MMGTERLVMAVLVAGTGAETEYWVAVAVPHPRREVSIDAGSCSESAWADEAMSAAQGEKQVG